MFGELVGPQPKGGDEGSDPVEKILRARCVVGVEIGKILFQFSRGQPVNNFKGREPVLRWILKPALQLKDPQLQLDVERVQEVSSEDDGVNRGVDGVDPARWDEQGLARLQLQLVAFVHHVAEECLRLAAQPGPTFIQGKIAGGWTDQEKLLLA